MGLGSFSRPFSELMGTEVFIASSDGLVSTNSESYVKVKEFTIVSKESGIKVRLEWQFWSDSGTSPATTIIYINGASTGILWTENVGTVKNVNQLVEGINDGDLIQIYAKVDSSAGLCNVRLFRVLGILTYLLPSFTATFP